MQKVQLSHRMYCVADIKRLIENGELIIQPKYQRRRTNWPQTAKTSLIDTLLNNYPIQPIYLRENISPKNERKKEIIDGQQRIATIMEFITDKYELSKNLSDTNLHGSKFSQIPFEVQQIILDYELSFISIRGANESDIISIFSKLNSFTLPLNSQEKRNAVWSGQFKTLIYKLSSLYSDFWYDFKIFSDKEIARMKEAQFVSELITTIYIGYDKYSNRKIDDMYKKYDERFDGFEKFYESFNNTMSFVGSLMETSEISNHFKKQSWFFTLFLCAFESLYFFPGSEKKDFNMKKVDALKTKENLLKLISNYKTNDIPNDIVQRQL
ncbi:MAG: DUF262 domain-containing protein [Bacteroidales bacterium]|jgi:hypothetical protein|nr:DUF262 domain-containing protein [Bacteroidales bacterium]